MSDKLAEQVSHLQRDLEKCLAKDEPTERIADILNGLAKIEFSSALIVSSKIANTINTTKKKFAEDASIKSLCKQLIQAWKTVYKNDTSGSATPVSAPSAPIPAQSSLTVSTKNTTTTSSTIKVTSPRASPRGGDGDMDDADDCEKISSSYPDGRRKIIAGIADALSLDSDGKKITNPVAFPLAFGIEAEIDVMFPFFSDLKGYQAKSRNIFFSLKSNAELRQDLLEGRLLVTDLLQLPKEQLATRAMREIAQKERDDMMLAKRNDYFAITRDQTMLENGLDPNAGGEHTCSKCKGQKTSSYSLQTRSADEPMTVFVTCLTCGKRWRC